MKSFDLAVTIREMHHHFGSVRALFEPGYRSRLGLYRRLRSKSGRECITQGRVSVRVHGHAVGRQLKGITSESAGRAWAFARFPTASTPCRGTVALLIAMAEKTMEAKPEWSASQDDVQEMRMLYLHAFHPAVVVPLNIRINVRYSCADDHFSAGPIFDPLDR